MAATSPTSGGRTGARRSIGEPQPGPPRAGRAVSPQLVRTSAALRRRRLPVRIRPGAPVGDGTVSVLVRARETRTNRWQTVIEMATRPVGSWGFESQDRPRLIFLFVR